MAAQHHGVRDRDFHVLDRANSCDQQRLFYDVADGVGNFDAVSELEGTHVSQNDASHKIGHRRCRSERKKHSEKNGDSLKSRRLGAGQIGKNHDQGKSENEEADNIVRGLRPLRVEAWQRDRLFADLREDDTDELGHVERHQDDYRYEKHIGQVGDKCVADEFQGREHIADENLRIASRPREKAQDQRCVEIQSHQNKKKTYELCDSDREIGNSIGREEFELLDAQRGDESAAPGVELLIEFGKEEAQKAENQDQDGGRDDGVDATEDEAFEAVLLSQGSQGRADALCIVFGKLIARLAGQLRVLVGNAHHDQIASHNVGRTLRFGNREGLRLEHQIFRKVSDPSCDCGCPSFCGEGEDTLHQKQWVAVYRDGSLRNRLGFRRSNCSLADEQTDKL